MTPLVELSGVDYVYGPASPVPRTALRGIDLSIRAGERLGIIGPTGSGKSTLLRLVSGEFRPTRGAARYAPELSGAAGRPAPGRIGLVFQYPEDQLFEETVLSDVAFGPLQVGRPLAEAEAAATRALDGIGLPAAAFGPLCPFDMSGGQKRKAAIAGVLSLDPPLLVFDEPTSGLDPASRRRFLDLLAGLHDAGRTVVMVSHDLEAVGEFADRVVALHAGRVARVGAAREVLSDTATLRALGIGAHPVAGLLHDLAAAGVPARTDLLTAEEFAAECRRLAPPPDPA